jgi:hypothetical protein
VVLRAFLAILAMATGSRRIDGDQIPDVEPGHVFSKFNNASRDLVAQYHWLLEPNFAEATVIEVVQIRSADASPFYANKNLMGTGPFARPIFNAQVLCRMYY